MSTFQPHKSMSPYPNFHVLNDVYRWYHVKSLNYKWPFLRSDLDPVRLTILIARLFFANIEKHIFFPLFDSFKISIGNSRLERPSYCFLNDKLVEEWTKHRNDWSLFLTYHLIFVIINTITNLFNLISGF